MMKLLLNVSALALCIVCMLATVTNAFILVGRNGVGRGESLKGANTVEESVRANDVTGSVSRYFASGSSGSSKDTGNSSSGAENGIAKCRFTAGANELSKDEQLPSFYIPSKDKELYESGIRELLSQVTDEKGNGKSKATAANTPSINLKCEVVTQGISSINCRLCMYNEISKDKKHLRQGQVLDVPLDMCILGSFGNNMNVFRGNNNVSDYHPICYPPSSTSSNNNSGPTRNRFRATVDNSNKYEGPVTTEALVHFVGETLRSDQSDDFAGGIKNSEVMENMFGNSDGADIVAAPDRWVLMVEETDVPHSENPDLVAVGYDGSGGMEPYSAETMGSNAQEYAQYTGDIAAGQPNEDVYLLDDSRVISARDLLEVDGAANSNSYYNVEE